MSSTSPPAVGVARATSTPAWWPLRVWLGAEVLFGLASSAAIFLNPGGSLANFAWPIKPDVMAATLGAIYASTLFTLIPSVFIRVWQDVRVLVLPGVVFTTVLLIATFLHWDRFSTTTVPFYIWFASYLLPPPIFAAMYWWHQRRSLPVGADIKRPLPAAVRTFLLVNGAVLTAVVAVTFVVPSILQQIAPWTFTPLTTRAFSGLVALVSVVQICMAWENDAGRAWIPAPMLVAFPFALGIQLYRFGAEVQWGNVALWVFVLDVVLVALASLVVLLQAGGAKRA
jgi:hypothetical protein